MTTCGASTTPFLARSGFRDGRPFNFNWGAIFTKRRDVNGFLARHFLVQDGKEAVPVLALV